ncbi:MAG: ScpA family protein [Alcaligenaceae bacterium]|nr:ScpA family protein [Alcaligenaceae bacterium]
MEQAEQLPLHLVKLYGEPLLDMPEDLYIPPDALSVFLQTFEGPLDLLLYLIRKKNFDILDIPMVELTAQYLAYIDQANHFDLAGEYLVMAAFLLEIKSRMLLPVPPAEGEEEVDDPRAELVRRLLQYEEIKKASLWLDQQPRMARDFDVPYVHEEPSIETPKPVVDTQMLYEAIQGLVRRAQLNQHHEITRESLSVRKHMSLILKRLSHETHIEFQTLFLEQIDQGAPPAVLVVHFMAILELAKESLISITQVDAYTPIYLKLR